MNNKELKVFLCDYYNNYENYYLFSILRYFKPYSNLIIRHKELPQSIKDEFKKELENLEWQYMLDDCYDCISFNKTIKKLIEII